MQNDPATQTQSGNPQDPALFAQRVKWASERLQAAQREAGKVILDQDYMIEMILATMVAGGNILAEGMPGLAKTLTVKTIARISGLDFKRIQFTPDLQPIDLTGSEVLTDRQNNTWSFREGPLFGQLILADEINRAGQKTQSAMLEAMEEKQITVDGVTRTLPRPFHVMATQNPVDQDGTSPLPEAQSDRFMTKLVFSYPSAEAEERIMVEQSSSSPLNNRTITQIFNANDLVEMHDLARQIVIPDSVARMTRALVQGLRPETGSAYVKKHVLFGPSPRALIAFALVAKARALMDGRIKNDHLSLTKKDILDIAEPVLQHRMAIKHSSRDVTFNDVMTHVAKELKL